MGSLVIIFPTAHNGGSPVIQDGHEWTFGAEKMLANSMSEAPVISYVAFYSDTEHEVLPVTSGVRVTSTYNLYLEDKKPTVSALVAESSSDPMPVDVPKPALKTLLTNKNFLPEGGLLGFGLRHQYPFAVSKYRGGTSSFKIDGNPNDDFNGYIPSGEFIVQGSRICRSWRIVSKAAMPAFYELVASLAWTPYPLPAPRLGSCLHDLPYYT